MSRVLSCQNVEGPGRNPEVHVAQAELVLLRPVGSSASHAVVREDVHSEGDCLLRSLR